ncbi:hypothetical protein ACRAWD_08370 [Caulobacter segnis]
MIATRGPRYGRRITVAELPATRVARLPGRRGPALLSTARSTFPASPAPPWVN